MRNVRELLANHFRKILLNHGVGLDRASTQQEVKALINIIKNDLVGVDLIRIGDEKDGGYLIPDDLDGINYCFSPGVSSKATFEEHLANSFGIKSFLADASVDNPPFENESFEFDKRFLGAYDGEDFMTLSHWLGQKAGSCSEGDMILQMDIEGYEYEVFVETPMDVLKRFRIMVVEFHCLDRITNKNFLRFLNAVFHKLNQYFSVVHLHPNNCCGLFEFGEIKIPRVLEITYLRKDRVKACSNVRSCTLPHPLDRKNIPHKKELTLPENWWR